MSLSSIVMSLVEETKLLPDERDSQTVCVNDLHDPAGMIPAAARLMPNSANCPAQGATPLIGFCAAVKLLVLTPPSAPVGSSDCDGRAPARGGVVRDEAGSARDPRQHVELNAVPPPR